MLLFRNLNHPNLLSLLGTVQRPHSLVLVTNYVKGCSLHNVIFGDRPPCCAPRPEARECSCKTCEFRSYMSGVYV